MADGSTLPGWAVEPLAAFGAAMDDDLNTPEALAALFDLVAAGNRAMDQGATTASEAAAVLAGLVRIDRVLGVLEQAEARPDAEVLALAEARNRARKERNWAEADRMRDALAAKGWEIRDTPEGPKLKPRRS